MKHAEPSRRALLQGVGAVAVVGAAVTACSDDGGSGPAGSGSSAAAGSVVGATSTVPVGGGSVFPDARVVVTQPSAGEFKGYSTRCTHQGCAVTSVSDGFIVCPCHNSRFAISDGAPTSDSLAKEPLAPVAVSVSGSDVVLG
ncbi:Rieske (2Fe-2S) protein [Angustibacter sp. McL0619]|uniref:Rieske (2Fe-2S) protein n=1 Tax=Angustibacter sp. McL0619 TaxID=3415676 RepID=UPI003CE94C52